MAIFPAGDLSSSPGLPYSATLGKDGERVPQPQRGCDEALPAYTGEWIAFDVERRRNPVGVAKNITAIPKLAEYSNLGL